MVNVYISVFSMKMICKQPKLNRFFFVFICRKYTRKSDECVFPPSLSAFQIFSIFIC